ncbi:MAG TPA: hypothetical protein VK988_08055 [Acidimicrobiales bacterium]|nr:hypothetical protein [Acidimicrobiales bacterium]
MEPLIIDSARKHGVLDQDILHAFNQPMWTTTDPDDDEVMMLVGPDRAGNLLEVGVVDSDAGPVIIHALSPARPKFFPR